MLNYPSQAQTGTKICISCRKKLKKQPSENSVPDEFSIELYCLSDDPSIAGDYLLPEVELGCLKESLLLKGMSPIDGRKVKATAKYIPFKGKYCKKLQARSLRQLVGELLQQVRNTMT